MTKWSHNTARRVFPHTEESSARGEAPSDPGNDLSEIGNRAIAAHRAEQMRAELARRCLRGPFAGTKEWASDLGVSARLVRMWSSGETMIPASRAKQIILQAREYRNRSRDLEAEIDAAIDDMLARAYGPAGRHSM